MNSDSSLPKKGNILTNSLVPQCSGSNRINYGMIPLDDLDWAANQKPAIMQLFLECWRSDPYGTRWMPLTTKLKDKTLKLAKAAIRKAGLFDFKSEMRFLENRRYYETLILNLHGSRRDSFWHSGGVNNYPTSDSGGVNNDPSQGSLEPQVGSSKTPGGVKKYPTNSPQTQSQQAFQNASISFQDHIYDQQQFNIASGAEFADEKTFWEEEEATQDVDDSGILQELQEPDGVLEEPQLDPIAQVQQATVQLLDEREIFDELRRLGIETNETVRFTLGKFKANVPDALASVRQRYDNRERFMNITGAFVKACQEGAKPRATTRTQVNPPSIEQMCQLEQAKASGTIRDFYLAPSGSDREAIVVDTGLDVMPWWEYLA